MSHRDRHTAVRDLTEVARGARRPDPALAVEPGAGAGGSEPLDPDRTQLVAGWPGPSPAIPSRIPKPARPGCLEYSSTFALVTNQRGNFKHARLI